MTYQTFTTLADADACCAGHRANGRRAYVITHRAGCHEVRSWA